MVRMDLYEEKPDGSYQRTGRYVTMPEIAHEELFSRDRCAFADVLPQGFAGVQNSGKDAKLTTFVRRFKAVYVNRFGGPQLVGVVEEKQ